MKLLQAQTLLWLAFLFALLLPINVTAQTAPVEKDNNGPVKVFCMIDGAELKSEPDAPKPLQKTPWLKPLVRVKDGRRVDAAQTEWLKVGEFVDNDTCKPLGWMKKDDLLTSQEAEIKDGVYRKAIIVVHYDRATKDIGGATPLKAPRSDGEKAGQELTLFNILHIYASREDVKSGGVYYLLGSKPKVVNSQTPEATLLGWVPQSKIHNWDTREAAEYDKSTQSKRNQVVVYETNQALKDALTSGKVDDSKVLARENADKKEVGYHEPRFPLISLEGEFNKIKLWNFGFIADEMVAVDDGKGGIRLEQGVSTRADDLRKMEGLANVVDVVFVIDGTGSMKKYHPQVVQVIKTIQETATRLYQEKYQGEKKPEVRFSTTIYKDYQCSDFYRRVPLEAGNAPKIATFVEANDPSGGSDEPAVFNGLANTLTDCGPEFDKGSLRMVFLIGDMGNLGNQAGADPKGHTLANIVGQLKTNDAFLYAVHAVGDAMFDRDPRFAKFKEQSEALCSKLAEGKSGYLLIGDPTKVKEQIETWIKEIVEMRLQLAILVPDVIQGRKKLGNQMSGTILDKLAIEIMKRNNVNPDDYSKQGVNVFGQGWAAPELGGIRGLKKVVLMEQTEVEGLIAFLGAITRDYNRANIRATWTRALEEVTGDAITVDPDKTVPAEVLNKVFGVKVRSGILNASIADVEKWNQEQINKQMMDLKKKLFLMRSVIQEKEIDIVEKDGEISFTPKGNKQYWFGGRGNEKVWLDSDVYLP